MNLRPTWPCLSLGPSLLFALALNADATELHLTTEPRNDPPSAVILIDRTGNTTHMQAGNLDNNFIGQISTLGGWADDYTVVASWSNVKQQLYLRITKRTPPKLEITVFNRRLQPNRRTLELVESLGFDFLSLLERYFVARDLHRQILNPRHEVKTRALKLWQDAAYVLSKNYEFIGIDPEIVKEAENAEEHAANDKRFAEVLYRTVKPGYLTAMNAQYIATEWREVDLVKLFRDQNRLNDATVVNNHFLKKYEALPEVNRLAIARTQGVTADLLKANASYLSKLQAKQM